MNNNEWVYCTLSSIYIENLLYTLFLCILGLCWSTTDKYAVLWSFIQQFPCIYWLSTLSTSQLDLLSITEESSHRFFFRANLKYFIKMYIHFSKKKFWPLTIKSKWGNGWPTQCWTTDSFRFNRWAIRLLESTYSPIKSICRSRLWLSCGNEVCIDSLPNKP